MKTLVLFTILLLKTMILFGQSSMEMSTMTCNPRRDTSIVVLAQHVMKDYAPKLEPMNTNNNVKDHLFLLNPNFKDDQLEPEDQIYYCPFNAMLEGVLHYYPHLRNELEITHIDFPRPRHQLIDLLGEENQGMPLLIIENKDIDLSPLPIMNYKEKQFIMGSDAIAIYLSMAYGIPLPH